MNTRDLCGWYLIVKLPSGYTDEGLDIAVNKLLSYGVNNQDGEVLIAADKFFWNGYPQGLFLLVNQLLCYGQMPKIKRSLLQ